MKTIKFTFNGTTMDLYPAAGAVVNGKRIAGLFRSIDDMRSENADNLAEAIVAFDNLTPDQQAIAEANGEEL